MTKTIRTPDMWREPITEPREVHETLREYEEAARARYAAKLRELGVDLDKRVERNRAVAMGGDPVLTAAEIAVAQAMGTPLESLKAFKARHQTESRR